jgi:sugar O-acyltransferase (sialic acid O-acetyltransferase NeuD family)
MLIIGAKGFAKEVLEILRQKNEVENVAFFDDINTDTGKLIFSQFPVYRNLNEVNEFFTNSNDYSFTIGIGNPKNRYDLYNKFLAIGGKYVSTISPHAKIGHYDNYIAEGCNIMTGTIITNSIKIGKGVLINLNCTIGHDSIIEDFVELCPGTNISGNCKIGQFSFLGTNSVVLPNISICANVIIGASAVVSKNITESGTYVGIPAKLIS